MIGNVLIHMFSGVYKVAFTPPPLWGGDRIKLVERKIKWEEERRRQEGRRKGKREGNGRKREEGREWNGRRREREREGNGRRREREGKGEKKAMWEAGEGNQVRGNFIHPSMLFKSVMVTTLFLIDLLD